MKFRRNLIWTLVILLAIAMGIGATQSWAGDAAYQAKMKAMRAKEAAIGQLQAKYAAEAAKAKAQTAVYDAQEKTAAAGAARATAIAAEAQAKQNRRCKVIGFVPVVGLAMRFYNSGEMKAHYAGKGNEQYWGVVHAFFKLPSALPEHAALDFLWQFTGSNWRELDPITVFLVDGRPYWMDAMVTGTKVFFGIAGAYALDVGLPGLGGSSFYAKPVNLSFLWMAAGGGGLNVATGIVNQAAQGLSPFHQYYEQYQKWTGKAPTAPWI